MLWSVHGPVLRRPHGTYAIRFANLGEVRMVEQWYRMNKARNLDEWRAAMRLGALPMFNSGYADRDGNVAYFYNARLPRRDPGYDWSEYLPGDTKETLWGDYLPFDELPQVVNPPSGVVFNANSTPFEATVGEGNPDPARYPASLGIERHLTNRALRLQELLGADEAISREAFDRYKMDVAYSRRSGTAKRVATLLDGPPPQSPDLREALAALGRWDLRANPENPMAALALFTLRPRFDNLPPATDRSDLLRALEASAERLRETFGRLDVPWGEVMRLRRGRPGPGRWAALPTPCAPSTPGPAEDGRLEGISGDCYILHVEWSPTGEVRSRSIHQFGSATLDRTSRHYADQAPLFARGEWKPVRLRRGRPAPPPDPRVPPGPGRALGEAPTMGDALSEQVKRLGELLGETLIEQEGHALFDRVEEVRALAKAHRAGHAAAGARLLARIEALPLEEARGVVKAFAAYFQLVNLAEEQERIRILRRRAHDAQARGEPMGETIEAAVRRPARGGHLRLGDAGHGGPPARHARLHRPPHRGQAPHRAHQALPHRGGAPPPRLRLSHPRGGGGAARARARGSGLAVADGGDPPLPPRGHGRGHQRPLLLRDHPLRPRPPSCAAACGGPWSASTRVTPSRCRCSCASGAGSAATATATPT